MNRPHQVWLLFAFCLALAAGGLGWLTHQTLELDRAEALARQQAEQEERVGLALWRMDAFLMPLLVQEAARPDFVYQANYLIANPKGAKEPPERSLSPVLETLPDFVRLHFQFAADGKATSPQVPAGDDRAWSVQKGIADERICDAQEQLQELTQRVTYAELLAQLPATQPTVGAENFQQAAMGEPAVSNSANPPPQIVESFAQQSLARVPQGDELNPPDNNASGGRSGNNYNPFGNNEQIANDASPQQAVPQGFNDNNFRGSRRAQPQQRNPNADLSSRNTVYQAYANKAAVENQKNLGNALVLAPLAIEGVSRPVWIGSDLILARRVERGGTTVIQGCWLDWPKLSERLKQEVADVLPVVELRPASVGDSPALARALATLPVQVLAPLTAEVGPAWSPIRLALALAWVGFLIAATAAAVTLFSVIALSERRAAFVAAVTHELRTPLTTFRMYAEMLAGGMVPREKQPTYLETLRAEADRLAHLVDNVLQYARLERGRNHVPREPIVVAALVERIASRLASRAEQAGLALEVAVAETAAKEQLTTDAAAVEQIIFNLVDNAGKYAAHGNDLRLHLEVARSPRGIVWRVRDHGPGISADGQRRLFQPFSKSVQEAAITAPGVGLGLALSRRLAQELGGELRLEQTGGAGTIFAFELPLR